MVVIAATFLYLLLAQQPVDCADAAACRALALEAQQRGDYETFHDLAWAAYRKGRANDPELMLLVARAQSVSGRPGDALVMLERMGPFIAPPTIVTDPDFSRVRALPRFDEVRQKLMIGIVGSTLSSLPDTTPTKAPAPSAKEPAPSAKNPAPSAKEPAPSAKKCPHPQRKLPCRLRPS